MQPRERQEGRCELALRPSRSRRRHSAVGCVLAPYRDRVANQRVLDELRSLVADREWDQFHSPENLAKCVVIEAGELLECFQWSAEARTGDVVDELADVLTYCHLLAAKLGVDSDQIVLDKLEQTRAKYPADKARGRSAKYDQLPD